MTRLLLFYWVSQLVAAPASSPWQPGGVHQNGPIALAQVDRVYYFYPTGNPALRQRNQAIAQAVAAYCRRRQAPAPLPDVLLYLFDQPADDPSTYPPALWVSYERYEGEFRPGGALFHHVGPSLSISLAASVPDVT